MRADVARPFDQAGHSRTTRIPSSKCLRFVLRVVSLLVPFGKSPAQAGACSACSFAVWMPIAQMKPSSSRAMATTAMF